MRSLQFCLSHGRQHSEDGDSEVLHNIATQCHYPELGLNRNGNNMKKMLLQISSTKFNRNKYSSFENETHGRTDTKNTPIMC